ncbi:hypothetical protein AVEN_220463-1 [Araneus ventricosus]|uniref:Uncharacterized protein n=1 Tax=Araneus ventricosus TaxID=182803 RepID=A0A4Y2UWA4_ARAVE|nr:hypothetical protein AVEN_220463-1 [Araneus ventricosus]
MRSVAIVQTNRAVRAVRSLPQNCIVQPVQALANWKQSVVASRVRKSTSSRSWWYQRLAITFFCLNFMGETSTVSMTLMLFSYQMSYDSPTFTTIPISMLVQETPSTVIPSTRYLPPTVINAGETILFV